MQVLRQRHHLSSLTSGGARHGNPAGGGGALGARRIGEGRLSWQELLRTEPAELRRIVGGIGNAVRTGHYVLQDAASVS